MESPFCDNAHLMPLSPISCYEENDEIEMDRKVQDTTPLKRKSVAVQTSPSLMMPAVTMPVRKRRRLKLIVRRPPTPPLPVTLLMDDEYQYRY